MCRAGIGGGERRSAHCNGRSTGEGRRVYQAGVGVGSIGRWRARYHKVADPARPTPLEATREFVEGGAGGHHVIDHDDPAPAKIFHALEGAARAAQARLAIKPGLRRQVTQLTHHGEPERQTAGSREGTSQLDRLIEAALGQPARVQRHRQHEVDPAAIRLATLTEIRAATGQRIRKKAADRELMTVFERVDHRVDREGEIEHRARGVEGRSAASAGGAATAIQAGQAALRASGGRAPRQLAGAAGADGLAATRRTADETVLRREDVHRMVEQDAQGVQ